MKIKKVAAIFDKSATPTNVKVNQVPAQCDKLRQKLLKNMQGHLKRNYGRKIG